jgi:response regulator RpfG family c-di-GMP phosphodiesterase
MSELAVVVADMRMPGMSGLELLQQARSIVPGASRVMLTSADDAQTAIAAINEGNVCRFLTKPCSLQVLEAAIWEAVDLRQTLHQLLDAQFRMVAGMVEVLSKVIQMVNPESHALAQRLRQRMRELALEMIHPDFWELEVAAMLAPLGAVGANLSLSATESCCGFFRRLSSGGRRAVAASPADGKNSRRRSVSWKKFRWHGPTL